MRIHEVTVRNFRGIRERTVSLCDASGKPRALTVMVGPNMCGKTTILDAIHLAYACIENANEPKLRPGLDPNDRSLRPDPTGPIEVDLRFSLDAIEQAALANLHRLLRDPELPRAETYSFRFQWFGDGKPFQITASTPERSNQAFRGRARAMIAKRQRTVGEKVFDEIGGVQYLDQHRSVIVKAPSKHTGTEDELAARDDDLLPWMEFVSRLHQKWDAAKQGESSWSRLRRWFGQLAAPAVLEDVVASDEGFDLRLRSDGRTYGANGMSSGEQQILRLACNLVARRAVRSVVLIDECELHLHSSWQRNVLHFLRSGGGGENQFVVTTHSESLRDLLAPEELVMLAPLES